MWVGLVQSAEGLDRRRGPTLPQGRWDSPADLGLVGLQNHRSPFLTANLSLCARVHCILLVDPLENSSAIGGGGRAHSTISKMSTALPRLTSREQAAVHTAPSPTQDATPQGLRLPADTPEGRPSLFPLLTWLPLQCPHLGGKAAVSIQAGAPYVRTPPPSPCRFSPWSCQTHWSRGLPSPPSPVLQAPGNPLPDEPHASFRDHPSCSPRRRWGIFLNTRLLKTPKPRLREKPCAPAPDARGVALAWPDSMSAAFSHLELHI